jgi:magnesium chelatase family protein
LEVKGKMSLAIVYTRAQVGIHAPSVSVEVHISNGLPSLTIVGLPETEVKESKERVRSALLNSNFTFPSRRITINLAPADLPKKGGRFDLAIALGILAASNQLPVDSLKNKEVVGELALTGDLKPVKGILSVALSTQKNHKTLIIPIGNGAEASLLSHSSIYVAQNLLEVCHFLNNKQALALPTSLDVKNISKSALLDLSDIKGQAHAKRALEIAAAGRHNLLLVGPPGTGKTMLASRISTILPPMTENEALMSAAVYSISNNHEIRASQWKKRPFRHPHHTTSGVALVGGGADPKPGEVSLAHGGVLFLDELPEFSRKILDVLREPIETGIVTISRAKQKVTYPAQFQLVAAMNPCPCGYFGDESGRCHCTENKVRRYQGQASGPLLDRIDLQVEVSPVSIRDLQSDLYEESSEKVKNRVKKAWATQLKRQNCSNALLNQSQLKEFCAISVENQKLLDNIITKMQMSARAYHRILKIARTIADLDQQKEIKKTHLLEAVGYRRFERYSI